MEEGWVKGKGATFWPQKRCRPSLIKIIKYTYDANGNLLREDEQNNVKKEFSYTAFDRIKTSSVSFGKTSGAITNTYRYDALQRRVLQEDKSQKTLRSVYAQTSLSVLNEWEVHRDGSAISNRQIGSRQYFYASGELYGIKEYRLPNSDIEYFYKDRQGSIKANASGDGRIRKRIDYTLFGEPLGNWSLSAGYTGKPYEWNTRLSNYGFRDYAPQTGHFTTVDPIRDGRNWYVYCNNDPVNRVDEWGLCKGDGREGKGVSFEINGRIITPFPVFEEIGYSGIKGFLMTLSEIKRGESVMKQIESYDSIIKENSQVYNIDPNIIRAIIYEEQTHNKTPSLETNSFIHSVGPMAVHDSNWANLSRTTMLNPAINTRVGTSLLANSVQRVKEKNQNADIAQIASNYNNKLAITVTTDYGQRVLSFYNWFKENYVE